MVVFLCFGPVLQSIRSQQCQPAGPVTAGRQAAAGGTQSPGLYTRTFVLQLSYYLHVSPIDCVDFNLNLSFKLIRRVTLILDCFLILKLIKTTIEFLSKNLPVILL